MKERKIEEEKKKLDASVLLTFFNCKDILIILMYRNVTGNCHLYLAKKKNLLIFKNKSTCYLQYVPQNKQELGYRST